MEHLTLLQEQKQELLRVYEIHKDVIQALVSKDFPGSQIVYDNFIAKESRARDLLGRGDSEGLLLAGLLLDIVPNAKDLDAVGFYPEEGSEYQKSSRALEAFVVNILAPYLQEK